MISTTTTTTMDNSPPISPIISPTIIAKSKLPFFNGISIRHRIKSKLAAVKQHSAEKKVIKQQQKKLSNAAASAASATAAVTPESKYILLPAIRLQPSNITVLNRSSIITELGVDRRSIGIELVFNKLRTLLTAEVQSIRAYGSCAMNICWIAAGRAEGYYEGLNEIIGPKPWDLAGAVLILIEAGGIVSDPHSTNVNNNDNQQQQQFNIYNGRVLATNNLTMAKTITKLFEPVVELYNKQQQQQQQHQSQLQSNTDRRLEAVTNHLQQQ